MLAACQAPRTALPSASTSSVPEATPLPPLESQLREAYRLADPTVRRASILAATDRFLRDDAVAKADDRVASTYYSQIAFSSGRLTLPEPALIRRSGRLAIVALPEGMGLILFDLSTDTSPVEISRWTVGLQSMDVTWGSGETGISFTTLGMDNVTRAHYALITHGTADWQVWLSDEAPDWWFNARGGSLEVSPDLSQIVVTGPAEGTTGAFYELGDAPRRTFRVVWRRDGSAYAVWPPVDPSADPATWYWQVAVASPYATLVEFVERLQSNDATGATHLASSPDVVGAAVDFGLQMPDRRFQIVSAQGRQIVFRDLQGTFVASFSPPQRGDAPWLIDSLEPVGVPTPTPSGP